MRQLLKSRLFWAGVIIRLILMSFWKSYEPLKLTLFFADIFLLWGLIKVRGEKREVLTLLYWFNPIIIYFTYVDVRFDLLAVAPCFFSLVLLTQQEIKISAALMAGAVLSSMSIFLLIPFVLVYLGRQESNRKSVQTAGVWFFNWLILCSLGFLLMHSLGYLPEAVASSKELLRAFTTDLNLGGGHILFLGLAVALLVLGRLCLSPRVSDEGLIYGSGVILGGLLVGTNALPQWYFWVIPFFCLFFALQSKPTKLLLVAFNCFYFVNFLVIPHFNQSFVTANAGIVFTLLQTSMVGILLVMWKVVLSQEHFLDTRQFVVKI